MTFLFRLRDQAGADLGTYASSEPNWAVGHEIYLAGGTVTHRVTAVFPPDDLGETPFDGTLVVEAVDDGSSTPNG